MVRDLVMARREALAAVARYQAKRAGFPAPPEVIDIVLDRIEAQVEDWVDRERQAAAILQACRSPLAVDLVTAYEAPVIDPSQALQDAYDQGFFDKLFGGATGYEGQGDLLQSYLAGRMAALGIIREAHHAG